MTTEQKRELQILEVICVMTMFAAPQILTREQLIEQTIQESRKKDFLVTEAEINKMLCKSVQCIVLETNEWS